MLNINENGRKPYDEDNDDPAEDVEVSTTIEVEETHQDDIPVGAEETTDEAGYPDESEY